MPTLCVRTKAAEDKERAIQAIRNRGGGVVDPEGNPITFWIITDCPVEVVKRLPDVEDTIVSGSR